MKKFNYDLRMKRRCIMFYAWRIARSAVKRFGGKAREYMSEALKQANFAYNHHGEYTLYGVINGRRMIINIRDLFKRNSVNFKPIYRHENALDKSYYDIVHDEIVLVNPGNKKLENEMLDALNMIRKNWLEMMAWGWNSK